jgi:exosortase
VNRRVLVSIALVAGALAFAYSSVAMGLVRQWQTDDNYSHGFIVLPLAIWFAWQRRRALRALTPRPSLAGLVVILGSVLVLLAGTLGAELFLSRVSLVGMLAGIVLFLFGPKHLRVLAFPIAFLLLMIPLPAIIFNKIAFPLQLFASRAGAAVLEVARVPVLREGNVLVLPRQVLDVAEAWSGIRSLVSLIARAVVLGEFTLKRRWTKAALALAAIPVAIGANALRVAGTGLASHFWSPAAAQGFFHEFSGFAMFGVAFAVLLALQRLASWIESRGTPTRGLTSTAAAEA